MAVRIVATARDAELFKRRVGWPRGLRRAGAAPWSRVRPGGRRRPRRRRARRGWRRSVTTRAGARVLDAEPAPVRVLGADQLDTALRAMADFADLKSPWFRGHSASVADLVFAAAATVARAVRRRHPLHRAAGRAGPRHRAGSASRAASGIVPVRSPQRTGSACGCTHTSASACCDAPRCSPRFADLATGHHERIDGSGYHRPAPRPDQLDLRCRLLAAADIYHALTEERPHRPAPQRGRGGGGSCGARSPTVDSAHREVDAVLDAAGHVPRRVPAAHPAGLTDREVDVLRLIARGSCQQAGGRGPRHRHEDRWAPRRAHLRQGRRHHPGRCSAVRHGARPCS